ncbi:MAG: hypothetical protein AB7U73_13915 [Pirellulales bacterium]
MSLKTEFTAELDRAAPFSGTTLRIESAADGRRLVCELVALDSLACAFDWLALHDPQLAGLGLDRLKQVADAISKRLTYLLEPITPIEVDPQQCTVQLRSNPPQSAEDATSYYELLVKRTGEVSICRYRARPGALRERIAAQVTREVLLRLVDDLLAVSP